VFEGAEAQALRTGFAVLGRLSEDHEEAAGWIAQVLGRDVAGRAMEAFTAAKAVGERTAHAALGMVLARALEREGTVDLAARLEPELPHPDQTVSLREVGRWVLEKRVGDLPEGTRPEERAKLLVRLSHGQFALGQHEAALASAQHAFDIYHKLSESRPEAVLPDLARALNSLGIVQSTLGQRDAALVSAQEAVDIRRKLSESRPEVFQRDLAGSLNNLSNTQRDLGQDEAALASSQEAVSIYRKLLERQPDTYLRDLAVSLNSMGTLYHALGQYEAALTTSQEVADTFRKLSGSRPDAFLPSLAGSLTNLGEHQQRLGPREAALASSQEAVSIYRRLSDSRPGAFLPGLASALHNLGNVQSAMGQREAALASSREAVELWRKLSERRPQAFIPDLAMSLNNLSKDLSGLGQREAALASAEEALDLIWLLFLRLPAGFERLTGAVLGNLLDHLKTLEQPPSPELLQRIHSAIHALLVAGSAKLSPDKAVGLADLQRALDLARATGDDLLLADAYLENAGARVRRQDYEDARMYYLTAASLYQKHGSFARYALANKLLVHLSLEVGRRDDAVRYYRSAEQILRRAADADALSDLQSLASKVESVEQATAK
jgi:tetratricopeptide (TPR) repeat protein